MTRVQYLFLLAGLMTACGSEKDDQSQDSDQAGKNAEHGNADDGDGNHDDMDTGNQDTGAASDIDGAPFEPDSIESFFYAGEEPVWVLTAKEGETWLYIENYPSFGGADGPETRALDDIELSYATCGVCVLLKTGCQPHGDHSHCETTFMPEAGSSLTFDELESEVGGDWSGSLSPIRFIEVSIDGSTYETTPVSGGEQIELDTWSFEVVLQEG